jgi:hypothetical protein
MEAVWREASGRQRTRSFARKTDAARFLATVEADLLRGQYLDPSAGKFTFKAFAEQWAAAQTVDAKTAEGIASRLRAHLLPAFGDMELRVIRPSTVHQWLGSASQRLAPGSVRVLLATLSAILGAAAEDGLIVSNPCRARIGEGAGCGAEAGAAVDDRAGAGGRRRHAGAVPGGSRGRYRLRAAAG